MTALDDRKLQYIKYIADGQDFYNTYRAQLTLDIENNVKTREHANILHNIFQSVGSLLNTGDWRSAYSVLCNTPSNKYIPLTELTELKAVIKAYIDANYTW